MKTREQIYGQEAAGILRDVSMYRALTEMQLLKLYEEADPHDVYGPFYRRYYHRRSFRLCCGNPR